MKKISRKLFMSILSMAFAIVALGTTTFAWFTMNATATASISVGVQSGSDGILISSDCKSFGSSAEIVIDETDMVLKPVTYVAADEDLSATNDKFQEMKTTTDAKANVLTFDLYFYTDTTRSFYFESSTTSNTVSAGSIGTYNLLKGFTYTAADGTTTGTFLQNQTIKVDSVNALRSTYDVYEYTELTGETRDAAMAAALADDGGQDWDALDFGTPARYNGIIGFTGGGVTTVPGVSYSPAVAYNFGQKLTIPTTGVNGNAANSYLAAINGTDAFKKDETTNYQADANYAAKDPANGYNSVATAIGENLGGYVTRVTFYFWLEGYDADCFDAIMGQNLEIKFGFTTTERTNA